MGYYGWGWRPYVSVAERRRKAARAMEKRKKQGHAVSPVSIEGRAIAKTFWGKAWCENLERYSDYANRLPRGRTYVRNGSVVDLQITPGAIDAYVSGSELYKVALKVAPVAKARWKSICNDCAGAIDSLVELLQGRLSKGVMERICRQKHGLFPSPAEIQLSCSCPDWASMCKHVAAVLYGIGARFDHQPELLFRLRAVDEMELIVKAGKATPLAKRGPAAGKLLGGEDLAEIFGLDMAQSASPGAGLAERKPAKPKRAEKAAAAPGGKRKPRKQAASTRRQKRSAGARKSQRPAEE
ncbi:MAG: SWIM zinc finger family protein [Acidobacteriota bacterium]